MRSSRHSVGRWRGCGGCVRSRPPSESTRSGWPRPGRSFERELGDDPERFARAWRALAEHWDFGDVNDLIEGHNRHYPAESRLPMNPRTGDFVLINGRPYTREPLDAGLGSDPFPGGRADLGTWTL